MNLLEECIEVLQPNVKVFPVDQSSSYSRIISDNFPITVSGRINWEKVDKKIIINDYSDIQDCLKEKLGEFEEKILIFWACADLPVLQTNFSIMLKYIDDVLAVDFDTWVISLKHRFIIEFYHDGDITIGFW